MNNHYSNFGTQFDYRTVFEELFGNLGASPEPSADSIIYKARRALEAKEAGDPRYMALCIKLQQRTGLSLTQVEGCISRLEQGQYF